MPRRSTKSQAQDRQKTQNHKSRQVETRNQRSLIIIACEGEKTEKYYFESWFRRLQTTKQISPRSCVIAPHIHTNPTGVLKDLVNYSKDGLSYADFEHRWIVIDRDPERTNGGGHTLEDFNNALQQAERKKTKVSVAWSNPCFELWYLLHFCYRDTSIDRDELPSLLNRYLGCVYQKNARDLFNKTITHITSAIRNAKSLNETRISGKISADKANPCTTVYELVEELLELEKEE